jgi:F-type H+-transporting ATPase subunit b
MNLLPNITLLIQLAIFLTVLFSLHFFLFVPLLRVMDKRKAVTEGVKEEVARLNQEAHEKLKEYEEKISQAKLRGVELKEKIRKQGEEEAAQILSKAKNLSEAELKEIQSQLIKEQNEARLQLRKTIEDLGKKMAEQVLEKKLGSGLQGEPQ